MPLGRIRNPKAKDGTKRKQVVVPTSQRLTTQKAQPGSGLFRRIFRTAAKTAIIGTLAVGGIKGYQSIKASNAAKERQRIEMATQARKAGIEENSIKLFEIYKLNATNKMHTRTVKAIEEIARASKISPARTMLTIEANMDNLENGKFTKFLFDSLENNSRHNPSARPKNDRIIKTLNNFNDLPAADRDHIIEMISQKGSYQQLKNIVEKEAQ